MTGIKKLKNHEKIIGCVIMGSMLFRILTCLWPLRAICISNLFVARKTAVGTHIGLKRFCVENARCCLSGFMMYQVSCWRISLVRPHWHCRKIKLRFFKPNQTSQIHLVYQIHYSHPPSTKHTDSKAPHCHNCNTITQLFCLCKEGLTTSSYLGEYFPSHGLQPFKASQPIHHKF